MGKTTGRDACQKENSLLGDGARNLTNARCVVASSRGGRFEGEMPGIGDRQEEEKTN